MLFLITVLVSADARDMDFWGPLTRMLSRHFSLVQTQGGRLVATDGGPPLIVSDMNSFDALKTDGVIILYKEAIPLTADVQGAGQIVAVVDSSREELMEHVSATRFPAVTCGFLTRDTITLSSIDRDSAVIDIRRAVTCMDGTRVEPCEIPISISRSKDSFLLMAVAAVLILSGNIKKLLTGKM